MTSDPFAPGRWRARWIWSAGPRIRTSGGFANSLDPEGFDRFVLFRRTFELADVPSSAPVRVTADSRYVLYVNGREVSRGPVRSNPRRLRYDTTDIASHVQRGPNVLAAIARFYGRPNPWWIPAPTTFSLGAGCFVCEARIGDEWVTSDGSWRVLDPDAWERIPRTPGVASAPLESVDARRLPVGWNEPDFDDGDWSAATEIAVSFVGATGRHEPPSDPYGPLLPRPIPPLATYARDARVVSVRSGPGAAVADDPVLQVENDEVWAVTERPAAEPVTIASSEDVCLVTYDFGGIVAGTAVIEVDAAPGSRIDASAAESLRDDGRLHRLGQHSGFRYIARGSDDSFETFDPLGARFVKIAVRNPTGPVRLRRVSVNERLYRRPDGPFFSCSDDVLDRVYEVGLRTVDLNAQDAYLDCPTREQRAWTGDAVVHQQVHLAANPDWGLARWHPQLAASPRPDGMLPMAAAGDMELADTAYIPDWALHWVRSVHNLYRYTGDRELVGSLLPVAERLLRWFEAFRGRDGLLHDVTGWNLIDWASVYVEGCSAAVNALWARALYDITAVADWLGDDRCASWARGAWAGVAEGFDVFWDDDRGVYVDHIVDGERRPETSQHVGSSAMCAGLVGRERIPAVVDMLADRTRHIRHSWFMQAMAAGDPRAGLHLVRGYPPPEWDTQTQIVAAEPFFRYVVHDALAVAGRADLVADACRDWKVFLDAGETTWPETWHGGTHCHGWCSTPTRDLVVYTLGISPAEPGFARASVAPRLGDLTWAKGAVPTPRGLLSVDVSSDAVVVDSPVPVDVDLADGHVRALGAGRHRIVRGDQP